MHLKLNLQLLRAERQLIFKMCFCFLHNEEDLIHKKKDLHSFCLLSSEPDMRDLLQNAHFNTEQEN